MRSIVARDDAGAVAILYALTLLVMIGFAALVLDLGALRSDRRAAQTTADFASIAGAANFSHGPGGSPQQACKDALRYFERNTPSVDLSPEEVDDLCSATDFPTTDEGCWDGTIAGEITERVPVDPYLVTLIWPVDVDSSGYSDEMDGDRCERFAVQIDRTRDFVFGRALDADEQGQTGARAVARGHFGEAIEQVSSLVVLDPTGCRVLTTQGSSRAGVFVWEGDLDEGGHPGIISVDSSGETCTSSNPVMHITGNNAQIKAGVIDVTDPPQNQGTVRDGFIFSFALDQGKDRSHVFQPAKLANETDPASGQLAGGHPSPIEPDPGSRFTREPVEHVYDCRVGYNFTIRDHVEIGDCDNGTDPHITQLRQHISDVQANPDAHGYKVETDCTFGDETLTLPSGKDGWWFQCAPLDVRGTLEIPNGDIVVEGGIDLSQTGSHLKVNTGGDDVDNTVVLGATGGGNLHKSGGADMTLGRLDVAGTFVLVEDGIIDLRGGGDALRWFAPFDEDYPFHALALWSERNQEHQFTGSSATDLDGIFYMPNANFTFGGGGGMDQERAQFIAYRLHAHGTGQLSMKPDPARAVTSPIAGVDLIR